MAAMVMTYPEMPCGMKRHYECLKATRDLEVALFGRVLSESILAPLERYSWWPLRSEPPRSWI